MSKLGERTKRHARLHFHTTPSPLLGMALGKMPSPEETIRFYNSSYTRGVTHEKRPRELKERHLHAAAFQDGGERSSTLHVVLCCVALRCHRPTGQQKKKTINRRSGRCSRNWARNDQVKMHTLQLLSTVCSLLYDEVNWHFCSK